MICGTVLRTVPPSEVSKKNGIIVNRSLLEIDLRNGVYTFAAPKSDWELTEKITL